MKELFFKGEPVNLEGKTVRKGDAAPDFIAVNQDFKEIKFSDYAGKIKVLTSFLSLDTSTCDLQVKRFNEEAGKISRGIKIIGISMDLPFAQKRFCEMNGIDNVEVISDYRYRSFGEKYGLLIKEFKLLARAILISREGMLEYVDITAELSKEPDYKCALNTLERLADGRL